MIFFFLLSLVFTQNTTFIDAVQLGKGGAATADIDNVGSVLLNPAGITLLESSIIYTSIQLNNSTGVTDFTDIYFGYNLDGKIGGESVGKLDSKSGETSRNSVGIFATYITEANFAYTFLSTMLYDLKYSTFTSTDDTNFKVDAFSTIDTVLQLSYAKSFLEKDKFRVGASAKAVYRVGKFRALSFQELSDPGIFPSTDGTLDKGYVDEGVAVLFDLGTQYSWFVDDNTISFGASVLDIGSPFIFNPKLLGGSRTPPNIPARVQTGFGVKLNKLFNSNYSIRGNVDMVKAISYSESSFMDMLRLGAEFNFPSFLSLRAGIFQQYWTAGFSLRYWIGHIDFATYTENADIYLSSNRPSTRRYVFQFSINM